MEVDGRVVSSIGQGMAVLVGFHKDDAEKDMDYIAGKILQLRIFPDDKDAMNLSLGDINGELLVISQFTLYGDARRGRRPSFSDAMRPDRAIQFYNNFINICKSVYPKVESGVFGAMMDINMVNSGPVTILLDSSRTF